MKTKFNQLFFCYNKYFLSEFFLAFQVSSFFFLKFVNEGHLERFGLRFVVMGDGRSPLPGLWNVAMFHVPCNYDYRIGKFYYIGVNMYWSGSDSD